ncbi:hypothetical protein TNCV_3381471 [Trichonephila clavipes]|nr:hypothetical protein TNCV_3381471 [Trichonephila clavipes]
MLTFTNFSTHFGNWNLGRFLHPISGSKGALRCCSWFGWMKRCGQYVKDQWRERRLKKKEHVWAVTSINKLVLWKNINLEVKGMHLVKLVGLVD